MKRNEIKAAATEESRENVKLDETKAANPAENRKSVSRAETKAVLPEGRDGVKRDESRAADPEENREGVKLDETMAAASEDGSRVGLKFAENRGACLLLTWAAALMLLALLGAWLHYGWRAALVSACGMVAAWIAGANLARLHAPESEEKNLGEPVELRCQSCGSPLIYYLRTDLSERENERPRRCFLCGGELELVEKEEANPNAH